MRHRNRGRSLSRDTEHRIALRRNMAQSLFEHGSIETTLPKAQEVKGYVEKLITIAKRGDLTARRRVIQIMQDRRLTDADQEFTGQSVVQKLFSEIAPKFADRPGGYTRIVKLGKYRIGDGGDLCLLSLVDEGMGGTETPSGTVRKAAGLRRRRAEKKFQFAKKLGAGVSGTSGDAGDASGGRPADEAPDGTPGTAPQSPESADEPASNPGGGGSAGGGDVTDAPESGDKA